MRLDRLWLVALLAALALIAPSQPRHAKPRSLAAPSATAVAALPPAEEPTQAVALEPLRAQLPDNLYWRMSAPTDDDQVLRQRADEARGWNELFGKVQAGTATSEEVLRYYQHRQQISEDYLAFAELLVAQQGDRLSERDRGLLALAIDMHRKRLAELPAQREAALARVTPQ